MCQMPPGNTRLWCAVFFGLLVFSLSFCSRSDSTKRVASLQVTLITDYEPLREFSKVRTTIGRGNTQDREVYASAMWEAPAADNLEHGVLVADISGAPLGPQIVRVELLSNVERVVSRWDVPLFFEGAEKITTVLSRGCSELGCTDSDGNPCSQCINGQCVEGPDSAPVSNVEQTVCGTQGCSENEDCPVTAACAETRCIQGICLQLIKPLGCDEPMFCNPNPGVGCQFEEGSICGLLCTPDEAECSHGYYNCETGDPLCEPIRPRDDGSLCSHGWCDGRGGCETRESPSEGGIQNSFGWALASIPSMIFVGAPLQDLLGSSSGAVYQYAVDPSGALEFLDKFETPVAPGFNVGEFGGYLAADQTWLAIGANRSATMGGSTEGSVYVYRRGSGQEFTFHQEITKPSGISGDWAPSSLAFSGDWLAVGSRYSDSFNGVLDLFSFDAATDQWVFVQELTAPMGFSELGAEIDMEDPWLVSLTTQEEALLYKRSGNTWALETMFSGGIVNDSDGSVSLDGNRLALRAPFDMAYDEVLIFSEDSGTWSMEASIDVIRMSANHFGSIYLQGDDLLIAEGSQSVGGPVRFYHRDVSGAWNHVRSYSTEDNGTEGLFGYRTAIVDDVAIVTAPDGEPPDFDPGAVYTFHLRP